MYAATRKNLDILDREYDDVFDAWCKSVAKKAANISEIIWLDDFVYWEHRAAHFEIATYFKEEVENILENHGVHLGEAYQNVSFIAQAILLSEAINWAAKTIDENFYNLKPNMIMAAIMLGSEFWYEYDEWEQEVTYLFHEEVGTASFHRGEVPEWIFFQYDNQRHMTPAPWSGWSRQPFAFELMKDRQLLRFFAWATAPRKMGGYPEEPSFEPNSIDEQIYRPYKPVFVSTIYEILAKSFPDEWEYCAKAYINQSEDGCPTCRFSL